MKNEIINRFCGALQRNGIEADWNDITNELVVILDDYDIKPAERALVVRDETINETLLQKFLVAKAVAGCTKKTLKAYKQGLTSIFNKIGKNVPDITADDIRLYLAIRQTRDGISKSFADTELRYLRSFYNYCLSEELITRDPTKKISKIKQDKKVKKAFTDLELEQLRGGCTNGRDKTIIEMLLSTGYRVSELANIKLSDIKGEEINILGKGNKERIVYLNAKAQYALNVYLNERKDKNPYLFPGGYNLGANGRPHKGASKRDWWKNPSLVTLDKHVDNGAIESFVRKLGKKVGVENVHPHRFRRTCATMALSRGMPLLQVSKMLGHEQLNTTQIYLDIRQEEVAAAHKKYVV